MKNIKIYFLLLLMTSVLTVSAQQIHEADESPVYQSEGSAMATSTVDGETLLKRSSIDPGNTLFGWLTGLTVMQNSNYNIKGEAGPTMYIRGIGTINNGSILVLVDGMERSLSTLVTEEIECVTVLKDAAALAIYGLKGANGVLLVTTKRGKTGKTEMNASYQHGLTTPSRLPKLANAARYAQAVNEGLQNEGLTPVYSDYQIAEYKKRNYPDYFPDVNWMEETLRQWGQRDRLNFSARGGSDKARFFSLINVITDRGLLKETNLNPTYSTQLMSTSMNIRTNLDINLTATTLMQANILAQINEMNRPGGIAVPDIMNNLYTLPPNVYPVRNANNIWGGGASTYPSNPVAQTSSTGYSVNHYRQIYTSLLLKQDLGKYVEGLNIEGSIGMDASSTTLETRSKNFLAESRTVRFDENGELIIDPETGQYAVTVTRYGNDDKELGFSSSTPDMSRYYNLQFRLNYNKEIGPGHLSSFLLYRQEKSTNIGQFNTIVRQGITAFGHYSLLNRYYLDLTLAAAGSSRLTKGNKWGFLPAAAAAWRLSQESFLENANWLDELKLRVSFGLAGNDRIQVNLDERPFVGGSPYIFDDNWRNMNTLMEGRLPSKRITFEKTRMFNVGLDAQLLQKLSFNADVFFNNTYDIIVSREGSIPSVMGATNSLEPDGIVKNYGMEFGLKFSDQTGDFKYNIGGQFSFVRNEIVNMNEVYQPYDYLKQTGRRIGQVRGLEAVGFFKDQADVNASPVQMFNPVIPGDVKYKDQNGDGVIDQYDIIPIGYANGCPEIYYSAFIDLEYRGFGVSALLQGVGNYTKAPLARTLYSPLIGNSGISEHYLESYWRQGANNENAKYPRLTTTQNDNNYRTSTIFIVDASFFKLRCAEVYYKLPQSVISKIQLDECKLFVRGNDLFTIDHIKLTDPEATGLGYPALKTYHIGLSVTF